MIEASQNQNRAGWREKFNRNLTDSTALEELLIWTQTTQLHLSWNLLVTTTIFIKVLRLFFQIKDDQFIKTKMIDRTLPVCESTYR